MTPVAQHSTTKKECRLPVSRILSTSVLPEAGRSFLSTQLDRVTPVAQHSTTKKECRLPVSRILSTSVLPEAGRSFLSTRQDRAPRLRGVRLIPGSERTSSPFPVMSCTTWGFHCRSGHPRRGGLLPHHFNLTCALASHRRCIFCCTIHPLVSRLTFPAFTGQVALRCPDFPQQKLAPSLRPPRRRLASKLRNPPTRKRKNE